MPMAKQARQIWTEKLGLVHPLPFSGVIFSEIGHLATIPIFLVKSVQKSTNYKTRMDPRDLQNQIILYCDYIIQDAQKNTQKNIPLPKQLQSAWRYYCFPCMCTKRRARYQNSEPPNQCNRSRPASRSNCTHLKEISPPQYHIYIDNTFRACDKNSLDKKPRARLIYITIRINHADLNIYVWNNI